MCYFVLLQKELAKLITLEQGKTLADAEGDVFRGLRKYQGSTFKGQSLKPEGRIFEKNTCIHAILHYTDAPIIIQLLWQIRCIIFIKISCFVNI